jgi:hypothetical protein
MQLQQGVRGIECEGCNKSNSRTHQFGMPDSEYALLSGRDRLCPLVPLLPRRHEKCGAAIAAGVFMAELQRAALVAHDGKRGKYPELLSARQVESLLAAFRVDCHPDAKEAERLATLIVSSSHRVRKFFDNQRTTKNKKRKANAPPGDEEEQRPATFELSSEKLRQLLGADLVTSGLESVQSPSPQVAAAAAAAAAVAPMYMLPAAISSAALESIADQEIIAKLDEFLMNSPPLPLPEPPSAAATVALSGCPSSRLELFNEWLADRSIDPFSCARRCSSVIKLATLLEYHGRTSVVSFEYAGACVLRTAFQQCNIQPPDSLLAWKTLLCGEDKTAIARVSRQSDSIWYHVRKNGVDFLRGVPAKARDDTLTALAITAAVAPHDECVKELVSHAGHSFAHASLSIIAQPIPLRRFLTTVVFLGALFFLVSGATPFGSSLPALWSA